MKEAEMKVGSALRSMSKRILDPPEHLADALMYKAFASEFGWTIEEIDDTDYELLMSIQGIMNAESKKQIDDERSMKSKSKGSR